MQRPNGPGEFHFTTKIGSFKLLGTNEEEVTGELKVTARGTILVSGCEKMPTTTGTLKLEYSYAPLKKYVFHGQGTLTVTGPLRAVQWFGTDLMGDFKGRGKFRLVGEFDKDLNTGTYWRQDPAKKEYWPANAVVENLVPDYSSSIAAPKAVPKPVPVPVPQPSTPSGKSDGK